MKKNDIQQLLDRFMDGMTTLDEERRLADYFRTDDVPEEWLAYKEMFAYFDAGMPAETHAAATESVLLKENMRQEKPRCAVLLRRWVVAAAIAVMAGAGIWVARNADTSAPQQIAAGTGQQEGVIVAEASDSLTNKPQTESVESQIATEQSGGVKAIEAPRDSTPAQPPTQPKRESMKYRFQPAPPKTYLAEADCEQIADSVNRSTQMMVEEKLREVEQRQQAYYTAIQVINAMAVADLATVEEEDELY